MPQVDHQRMLVVVKVELRNVFKCVTTIVVVCNSSRNVFVNVEKVFWHRKRLKRLVMTINF